jgi:hypothetical protein
MGHKTPISKIIRAEWTGGMAQVVECLLCKSETLSSNTSPTKKERGGRGEENSELLQYMNQNV